MFTTLSVAHESTMLIRFGYIYVPYSGQFNCNSTSRNIPLHFPENATSSLSLSRVYEARSEPRPYMLQDGLTSKPSEFNAASTHRKRGRRCEGRAPKTSRAKAAGHFSQDFRRQASNHEAAWLYFAVPYIIFSLGDRIAKFKIRQIEKCGRNRQI